MRDVPHRRGGADSYPPCPLSKHCERLAEYLDENGTILENDRIDNAEDRKLLKQLQAHIPTCPTCSSILATIHAQRTQQRQLLRQLLVESEQKVPSNTARIMQAIRREQDAAAPTSANGHDHTQHTASMPTFPIVQRQNPRRSRKLSYTISALVAALAIIVLSATLFSYMSPLSGGTGGGHVNVTATIAKPTYQVTHANTWSSVILTQVKDGQKIITALDPVSGKSAVLATSRYPAGTVIDGVSHDGYQVLYHVFDGAKTYYYLQPSTENTALYTLAGKGGPAVWNTDNSAVFISTPTGIEKIDSASHQATLAFPKLDTPNLLFYRDGYLYFASNDATTVLTGLYRIDITTGKVAPLTAPQCKVPDDFWLSVDGSLVYYRCRTQPGLYAMKLDGTDTYTVRANGGQIIGYAAQGEILLLQEVGTTFQVIEFGVDAQHDRVIVADVAPGASVPTTAGSIAVSPYGLALVAMAQRADGSNTLWYHDLVSNKQSEVPIVLTAQAVSHVELDGWSRLAIT